MTVSMPIAHPPIRRRAWLPYLAGFLVTWGALHATASLEATGNLGLVILAVTLSAAALVEVFVYRTPTVHVLSLLGFGRPRGRALLVAAGVSAVILGVVPLFTLVTGQSLGLRSNWPWLLIGSSRSTAWPRSSRGGATPSGGCAPDARTGAPSS